MKTYIIVAALVLFAIAYAAKRSGCSALLGEMATGATHVNHAVDEAIR